MWYSFFWVNWGNSCIEFIHLLMEQIGNSIVEQIYLFICGANTYIHLLMEQIGNSIVEQIHLFICGANTYMTYINLLSQYIHSFIYWVNTVIYLYMKQIQISYFI